MVRKREIIGKVTSGLGKGAYFVGLSVYKKFFQEVLGEDIFEGTLNIELSDISWKQINFRRFIPNGAHGEILYCLAKLSTGERVMIIRPKKSKHRENIVEVVSTVNLRNKYKLKDGDIIKIIIEE